MKIFDCTTYFDEPLIMDVRFNILNEYVYKFIIVESTYSHRGIKKKINFDKNLYPKFRDKIEHVIVDEEPLDLFEIDLENKEMTERSNSVKRIEHQRNKALNGCKEALENDYIFYSDNDEIPNFEKINFNEIKSKILVFEQKLFHYKFNLLNDRIFWYGTKGIKKKDISTISNLRNIKSRKYHFYRFDTFFSKLKFINIQVIKNGGWHFTQLKSPKDLYLKFKNDENFIEFDSLNINVEKLKYMIDNKFIEYNHLADTNSKTKHGNRFNLKTVDIKTYMPKYLIENLSNYKEWFDFNFKNI